MIIEKQMNVNEPRRGEIIGYLGAKIKKPE